MKNIAIQCLLRPALTVVDRCLDYDNFRATIDRIDRLLIDSEVESQAIELALEGWQPMGLTRIFRKKSIVDMLNC